MGININKQQIYIFITITSDMSFQNQTVQSFVPNYVVKSDYLPTKVVEGNTTQTAQLVNINLF